MQQKYWLLRRPQNACFVVLFILFSLLFRNDFCRIIIVTTLSETGGLFCDPTFFFRASFSHPERCAVSSRGKRPHPLSVAYATSSPGRGKSIKVRGFAKGPISEGAVERKRDWGSGLLIFFILPRATLQNKRQNRHFFATKPAERSQSIKISAAGGGCNCKFRPILLYWNCYFESENGGNPCIAMESSACWRWCCRCAA